MLHNRNKAICSCDEWIEPCDPNIVQTHNKGGEDDQKSCGLYLETGESTKTDQSMTTQSLLTLAFNCITQSS